MLRLGSRHSRWNTPQRLRAPASLRISELRCLVMRMSKSVDLPLLAKEGLNRRTVSRLVGATNEIRRSNKAAKSTALSAPYGNIPFSPECGSLQTALQSCGWLLNFVIMMTATRREIGSPSLVNIRPMFSGVLAGVYCVIFIHHQQG